MNGCPTRCPTCHRWGDWPRTWCWDCWPIGRSWLSPRGRPEFPTFRCCCPEHPRGSSRIVGPNMRADGHVPWGWCADCEATLQHDRERQSWPGYAEARDMLRRRRGGQSRPTEKNKRLYLLGDMAQRNKNRTFADLAAWGGVSRRTICYRVSDARAQKPGQSKTISTPCAASG